MTSTTLASTPARSTANAAYATSVQTGTAYAVPVARAFFALIFVMAGFNHALQPGPLIPLAAQEGVPLASVAVPFAGLLALAGGLSVLLGFKARLGAWLLVLFLVPVTLAMHKFWAATDPMMGQIHQAMFMKNLALLGGALLLAHFGAGPFSLDARADPRAAR